MTDKDSPCWMCKNYWKGKWGYGGTCPASFTGNRKGCTAYEFNPNGIKIRTIGIIPFEIGEDIYNVGDTGYDALLESGTEDNRTYVEMFAGLQYNKDFCADKYIPVWRYPHITKINHIEWVDTMLHVDYEYWYWLYGTAEEREMTEDMPDEVLSTAYDTLKVYIVRSVAIENIISRNKLIAVL